MRPTGLVRRRAMTSPAWMCSCCGKIVVRLKKDPGPDGKPTRYIVCYVKGWTGSHWWTGGVATPHPRKRHGIRIWKPLRDPDPLFNLG